MNFQDLFFYLETSETLDSNTTTVQENRGILPGEFGGCSDVHNLEENAPAGEMDLASDCISSGILHNYLILQKIFRYLDLKNLKAARLVCRNWSREAARSISHTATVIRIRTRTLNTKDNGLVELSTYLFRNKIQHSCVLSLVRCENILQTFYPSINTNRADVFDHLKLTGGLVRKLRLKMVLLVEGDSRLLSLLLTCLTNLETLGLDLVRYQIAAFISPIFQDTSFPSIKTLGLRFDNSTPIALNDTPTAAAVAHLLKIFKNVEYLDLLMGRHWYYMNWRHVDPEADGICLEAVVLLHAENPEYLCRLKGLRVILRNLVFSESPSTWRHVENFPHPLVSMECTIFGIGIEGNELGKFMSVLTRHARTITLLNLNWHSVFSTWNYSKISLPYLPNLTTLNFDSLRDPEMDVERLPLGYLDVLGLREIFVEGESMLQKTLPSLTTLNIALHCETGVDAWHHIFPDVDKNGMPLEIKQIKFLTVSISTECEDSEISRFHRIFPNLDWLRHKRPEIHRVVRNRTDFFGSIFNWTREEMEKHDVGCEHFKVENDWRKSTKSSCKSSCSWEENLPT